MAANIVKLHRAALFGPNEVDAKFCRAHGCVEPLEYFHYRPDVGWDTMCRKGKGQMQDMRKALLPFWGPFCMFSGAEMENPDDLNSTTQLDIHHLDGNPANNGLWNLSVIEKSVHSTLHRAITRNDHAKRHHIESVIRSEQTKRMQSKPHWAAHDINVRLHEIWTR